MKRIPRTGEYIMDSFGSICKVIKVGRSSLFVKRGSNYISGCSPFIPLKECEFPKLARSNGCDKKGNSYGCISKARYLLVPKLRGVLEIGE
jgi:hypothetical protein